jgi:nucleotidyltransferase substrate binding protein (TIGR01987 family)
MRDTSSLDFSSLDKAIKQLQKSLSYLDSDLAKNDSDLYAQFRSASIQAFEYCYELGHKSLKRYLQKTMPSQEIIDIMSFPELIRTGYETGLLQNSWNIWREYRDARNHTSHAYAEHIADSVLLVIPKFLHEIQFLYLKLNLSSSNIAQ